MATVWSSLPHSKIKDWIRSTISSAASGCSHWKKRLDTDVTVPITMASWTVYLVAFTVGLIAYLYTRREKRKLPPGPWAWPIIGNSWDMKPSVHSATSKFAKEYGDIATMYFGRDRTIILSDPNLVREAFNDPAMSGRPDNEAFTLARDGPHGLIFSEGQEWVEQRRFTLRHLRDFGFGKTTGEELITNELKEFIQGLDKKVSQTISINKSFGVAVVNTLWMMLSGVRYDQDDPRLWSILKQIEESGKLLEGAPLVVAAPKLAKMFPKWTGYDVLKKTIIAFRTVPMEHVNKHKEEINYDDHPRDFIEVYLKEIKATTNPSSSFFGSAGIRSLTAVVTDMFGAGADTTSTTLSWLVLYLAQFPHVQAKLHAELDEVVGKSRSPVLADRPNMVYVEAIITEAMRMSSMVPIGVFHRAMKDVKFHGYDIPKGTWVIANLHYIHHSPKIWGNPEEFQPERFLSSDGKSFKKHDAWMPFSTGKRVCLGETLARDTLFLYFTNIYQKFSIRLAEESKNATLDPAPGFLLAPQDFKVVLTERQ